MGGGNVGFPVTVPILTLEIKAVYLSDTAPTPADGYEVVLVKDLGFTKLWMEIKIS